MTRQYTRRQQRAAPTHTEAPAGLAPAAAPEPAEQPRVAMRPAMRVDDPRAAAAARTAELLDRGIPDASAADKFYAPPPPDGWEYEWKTFTVINQENPGYQVALANGGWTPVPVARHREMMPTNHRDQTILLDGMMLMERPKEISDMVRRRDQMKAVQQVRQKEAQLGGPRADGFDASNKGDPLNNVRKTYSPVEIPAEN